MARLVYNCTSFPLTATYSSPSEPINPLRPVLVLVQRGLVTGPSAPVVVVAVVSSVSEEEEGEVEVSLVRNARGATFARRRAGIEGVGIV